MNRDLLEKNLLLLSDKDPDLAKRVEEADVSAFSPPKETLEEAKKRWEELDLSSTQVLYVYGIGQGFLYSAALAWLKEHPDRFLAFIEDDIRVIAALLGKQLGTQLISDPKVKLFFLSAHPSDTAKLAPFLEHIAWYYSLLGYQLIALPAYASGRADRWKILKESLYQVVQDVDTMSRQHHALGKESFTNMYLNLIDLDGAYEAKGLKGKFKGIPAIICGAGPSLAKHIPLLAKMKNKAVIFAGGSSLPLLNSKQLEPHFGGSIDPNPPYRRFYLHTSFECPFFFQMNSSHDILFLVHGPRIPVSNKEVQLLEEWFEKQLGMSPDLIGFHLTVGQLTMKMADYLGCSPIILLGMDFALTGEKYYAEGLDSSYSLVSKEEKTVIVRPDMYGNPVQTKWDWELAVMQISHMATTMHPNPFINSTEGGLGFKGIPNIPFAEAAQKYLTRSYDTLGHVHASIQNSPRLLFTKENRVKVFSQIIESLKRCMAISEDLMIELHTLFKNKQPLEEKNGRLAGKAGELFDQLEKELVFTEVLQFFWKIFDKSMPRYVESMQLSVGKSLAAVRYKFEEVNFYHIASKKHLEFIADALKDSFY